MPTTSRRTHLSHSRGRPVIVRRHTMKVKERRIGLFGRTESELAQERRDALAKAQFELEKTRIENAKKAEKEADEARKIANKAAKADIKNKKREISITARQQKLAEKTLKANKKAQGFFARRRARKDARELAKLQSGGEESKKQGLFGKVVHNVVQPTKEAVSHEAQRVSTNVGKEIKGAIAKTYSKTTGVLPAPPPKVE
jgi:hypothetical protein